MLIAERPLVLPTSRPWHNFFWLVGGRAFRGAISLVIGVWVARYLGPTNYGILNSSLALVMMLMAVGGLGLDSLVRQELVRNPESSEEILGTCMALRLAAGAFSLLILLLLTPGKSAELRTVWIVMGLMLITHVPLSLDFWFQATLQLRYSTIAQNTAFAISSVLRALFIFVGAATPWFAAAIVLEGPVTALMLFFWHGKISPHEEAFRWNASRAKRWLHACWPLLLANLLAVAFTQLNQFLMVWLSSAAEAGRFAAATRMFELGAFVLTALVTTHIPEIAASRDQPPALAETALRGILNRVAVLGWAIAVPIVAGAPWIVRWLFGHDYQHTEPAIRWMMFGLLPFGLGLVRHEYWIGALRTRRLLAANIVGAVLNLGLAFICIPRWGATGAAAATVVSLTVTHLGISFFWGDTRRFAAWQRDAFFFAQLWHREKTPVEPKAM